MLKRDITQLTIYQIDEKVETVSLSSLVELYLKKTSEIVYIMKETVLYGVICIEDIMHHSKKGNVCINRNYTFLKSFNVIKAHQIFKTRKRIHQIPVVNERGELLGDYSCYDDLLYIERSQARSINDEIIRRVVSAYEQVYVIQPIKDKYSIYKHLLKFLNQYCDYSILTKEQIGKIEQNPGLYIFLDEDEKKGIQCLYKCMNDINDILVEAKGKSGFITYANLLQEIAREVEYDILKIEKIPNFSHRRVDEKATFLLSTLKEKGINCFCMYSNEQKITEYGKKFEEEVRERLNKYPINMSEPWPKKETNEEYYKSFFGELCELEDYVNGVVQREVFHASIRTFEYKKNIVGKYFNARDGKRITYYQPVEYVGTVYLLGPCTIIGAFCEDKYTIASYLQKKINENGFRYKVENLGAILRNDSEIDCRLQEIRNYQYSDIVIILSNIGEAFGIPGKSLEKIFENNQIPSEWVTNEYMHCNHKSNEAIADSMFEMISPIFKG